MTTPTPPTSARDALPAHTPGPWKAFGIPGNTAYAIMAGAKDDFRSPRVAYVHDNDPRHTESDALLIAAAPDLLEACKAQHRAIDTLFAMLIERSAPGFSRARAASHGKQFSRATPPLPVRRAAHDRRHEARSGAAGRS